MILNIYMVEFDYFLVLDFEGVFLIWDINRLSQNGYFFME